MAKIDITNYLYHGIIDWETYQEDNDDVLCLQKLESILKHRYILRPCEFNKQGIEHDNTASIYTHNFTFLACANESVYASRFQNNIKENGLLWAFQYAKFGFLISPQVLKDLPLSDFAFCNQEIVIQDDISLDHYGKGMYVNANRINEKSFWQIKKLLELYNYHYNIVNMKDGTIINDINEEKERINTLTRKL